MLSKFKGNVCLFFLVNLIIIEAANIPVEPPTQKTPVLKGNVTEPQRRWTWNEEKTRKFNKQMEADEQRLRETKAYDAVLDLIGNPGCDIEPITTSQTPGSILLTALGTSSLLVAKGCPDRALGTVRALAEALTGSLVNPVDVKNKSKCSSEAETALRILLSDHPRLKHLYVLMATGVYTAYGCKHLEAKVLPILVRYTTQYSEVHRPLRLFSESSSDETNIFNSIMEMEQVEKRLQDDVMLPEEDQRTKRRSECPSMATEAVGSLAGFIPVVGPIYSGFSLVRNIARGCVTNVLFEIGSFAVKLMVG